MTDFYQVNVIKMFNIIDRATASGSSNDMSEHNKTLWSCPRPTHAASTLLVSCAARAPTSEFVSAPLAGPEFFWPPDFFAFTVKKLKTSSTKSFERES